MAKRYIFLLFALIGCSHTQPAAITYKYYGLDFDANYLRGPQAKDDIPLMNCRPTPESKSPCVVLFEDDFYNLLSQLIDLRNQANERK